MKSVVTIVGARPQFIKAAPVSRAFRQSARVSEVLVHTGQHFDDNMSDVFFDELGLPEPGFKLGISGGSHGRMTGRMMEAIEAVLIAHKPDMVLVYGDTNSTLAGALSASKLHIPVAHVEAGLRSFNKKMPEEINRIVTDHVSDLLYCPTRTAVGHLSQEGITTGVKHVGDVMFDACLAARQQAIVKSKIIETLGLDNTRYAVCTLHRPENTDDPERLRAAIAFLGQQANQYRIVFPIHPRAKALLERAAIALDNFMVIEPLGYLDFHRLVANAQLILTDSGGLQKEAYFHGVPCITMRDQTEWVETLEHGWNRLWRTDSYTAPRVPIEDYGSGDTAVRIVQDIEVFLS